MNNAIRYYHSPVGWLQLVATDNAISEVSFVSEAGESVGSSAVLDLCQQQLEGYFDGTLTQFSVPLRLEGTPFQKRVWEALQTIPFGATWSYSELAQRVGNAKACRAVGGANHRNPIAILVPCHRVIGASGALTGYAGGLERKQSLLAHEQRTQ
ncbi:MAG: methylated-DNA--[protein]-cysteine S-methyltransferase [Paludibacteraceae bacterium]|nr:methylated-DNA--[protein]-cysteine S-methyltransferase [Paludibacteraceae bacterium]